MTDWCQICGSGVVWQQCHLVNFARDRDTTPIPQILHQSVIYDHLSMIFPPTPIQNSLLFVLPSYYPSLLCDLLDCERRNVIWSSAPCSTTQCDGVLVLLGMYVAYNEKMIEEQRLTIQTTTSTWSRSSSSTRYSASIIPHITAVPEDRGDFGRSSAQIRVGGSTGLFVFDGFAP